MQKPHILQRLRGAYSGAMAGFALHDKLNPPTGHVKYEVRRAGKLIERVDEKNLIVVASQAIHSQLLGGAFAGNNVAKFGVGTNLTPPVFGNTSLTAQYTNAIAGVSYPNGVTGDGVQFAFGLGSSDSAAYGMQIGEFGLLTPTGLLYARKTRTTPLNFENDISLVGTWTITF
jgi:hypothetical protein